jgi:hypothetical protein
MIRHIGCSLSSPGAAVRANQSSDRLAEVQTREELEVLIPMAKDDRDILEILQEELDFVEKGGYGRSVRTPWLPKSIFQDSLSCLNYGYPNRVHPCTECRLLDFVAPEHRTQTVPCHYIPLDKAGDTIEALESEDNESKMQRLVREWLRTQINQIQAERQSEFRQKVD